MDIGKDSSTLSDKSTSTTTILSSLPELLEAAATGSKFVRSRKYESDDNAHEVPHKSNKHRRLEPTTLRGKKKDLRSLVNIYEYDHANDLQKLAEDNFILRNERAKYGFEFNQQFVNLNAARFKEQEIERNLSQLQSRVDALEREKVDKERRITAARESYHQTVHDLEEKLEKLENESLYLSIEPSAQEKAIVEGIQKAADQARGNARRARHKATTLKSAMSMKNSAIDNMKHNMLALEKQVNELEKEITNHDDAIVNYDTSLNMVQDEHISAETELKSVLEQINNVEVETQMECSLLDTATVTLGIQSERLKHFGRVPGKDDKEASILTSELERKSNALESLRAKLNVNVKIRTARGAIACNMLREESEALVSKMQVYAVHKLADALWEERDKEIS